MTELMPCPFCGLIPRVIEDTQGHDFQIFCVCEAEPGFSVPKENREHAISAWNTRPAPSPSREGWLTEGLERLAKLGNGDRHGNSEGNVIAQDLLRKLDALTPDALRPAGDEGKLVEIGWNAAMEAERGDCNYLRLPDWSPDFAGMAKQGHHRGLVCEFCKANLAQSEGCDCDEAQAALPAAPATKEGE